MPIYYPLQMPTNKGIMRAAFRARSVVGMSRSPFSGSQQVYQWPGEWWEAECTLPQMVRSDAEQWAAFLTSLRGPSGTFLLGDPAAKTPMGTATRERSYYPPVIQVASQSGSSLTSRGWQDSGSGLLLPGDYFQIQQNQLTTGYELGDATWVITAGTKTSGVSGPWGDADGVTITPTVGSTNTFLVNSTNAVPAGNLPGLSLTFAVWLKAAAAFSTEIQLQFPGFSNSVHPISLTTAWDAYIMTVTAPAGATSVICAIGGDNTWAAASGAVSMWGASLVSPGIAARLHKVTKTFSADSGGVATIDIFPRLRETPIPLSLLSTSGTVGTFRLADSSVEWDEDKAKIYSLGFKAIEAI